MGHYFSSLAKEAEETEEDIDCEYDDLSSQSSATTLPQGGVISLTELIHILKLKGIYHLGSPA